MYVFVNGEQQSCPEPTSLAQLIDQLGMKGDRVAVELNREIVPRSQWSATPLHDGDRLEIVHFVGGGTASRGICQQLPNSQSRQFAPFLKLR